MALSYLERRQRSSGVFCVVLLCVGAWLAFLSMSLSAATNDAAVRRGELPHNKTMTTTTSKDDNESDHHQENNETSWTRISAGDDEVTSPLSASSPTDRYSSFLTQWKSNNPTIVVGMPKAGTTSIAKYFLCGGLPRSKVKHYIDCGTQVPSYCGQVILKNVQNKRPPLENTGDAYIYAQLDVTNKKDTLPCYFPQIQALEQIHEYYPESTLILNLRDLDHWAKSIKGWNSMQDRFVRCNVTGFETGKGETVEELKQFYADQIKRIRQFVETYPSHRLVEVVIDQPGAGEVMEATFGINASCWGSFNVNKEQSDKRKKRAQALSNNQTSGAAQGGKES